MWLAPGLTHFSTTLYCSVCVHRDEIQLFQFHSAVSGSHTSKWEVEVGLRSGFVTKRKISSEKQKRKSSLYGIDNLQLRRSDADPVLIITPSERSFLPYGTSGQAGSRFRPNPRTPRRGGPARERREARVRRGIFGSLPRWRRGRCVSEPELSFSPFLGCDESWLTPEASASAPCTVPLSGGAGRGSSVTAVPVQPVTLLLLRRSQPPLSAQPG